MTKKDFEKDISDLLVKAFDLNMLSGISDFLTLINKIANQPYVDTNISNNGALLIIRNRILNSNKMTDEQKKDAATALDTIEKKIIVGTKLSIGTLFSESADVKNTAAKTAQEAALKNNSIEQWFTALDFTKKTYKSKKLFHNVKDKTAVDQAAANKLLCLADFRKIIKEATLGDGAAAFIRLQNMSTKDMSDEFLKSLVMIAQTILLEKLGVEQGIEKITPQNYNRLLAELELLPFKEDLKNNFQLLEKTIKDIEQQIFMLKNNIAQNKEFPPLSLLDAKGIKYMQMFFPPLTGQENTELNLKKRDADIKEVLLSDDNKKEKYEDYKNTTLADSLDYAATVKQLVLLQEKLTVLKNLATNNLSPMM